MAVLFEATARIDSRVLGGMQVGVLVQVLFWGAGAFFYLRFMLVCFFRFLQGTSK